MVVEGSNDGQESVSAVLCSGGLDSAVLVAHEAQVSTVQPVYVNAGFAWETLEREYLTRLLRAPVFASSVRPWVALDCPVADSYPESHWALVGEAPAYVTPDEDVYLVGRNVLLLSKVAVYCAISGISRVVVGPLKGNPFPDATPEFFGAMAHALSTGLECPIRITTPFLTLTKSEVIRRGADLGVPWEHTLSCMSPTQGAHCGRCSKCRERLQAFEQIGLTDPAEYAFTPLDVSTGR